MNNKINCVNYTMVLNIFPYTILCFNMGFKSSKIKKEFGVEWKEWK